MAKKKAAAPEFLDDEHAGKGGSYIVVDGKRQLVERTVGPDDPEHPAHPDNPANARKEEE